MSEFEEFNRYVKDNKIIEFKKIEMKNKWNRDELEAMKLIYSHKEIPTNDDIKKLVDRQHKENMNLANEISFWNLGFCLLNKKPT